MNKKIVNLNKVNSCFILFGFLKFLIFQVMEFLFPFPERGFTASLLFPELAKSLLFPFPERKQI